MKYKVPVVPGTPGPVSDPSEARAFVEEYGFPVIIKAIPIATDCGANR